MNYIVETYRTPIRGVIDWSSRQEFKISAKPYGVLARFFEETQIQEATINKYPDMIEIILDDEIYFIEEILTVKHRGIST